MTEEKLEPFVDAVLEDCLDPKIEGLEELEKSDHLYYDNADHEYCWFISRMYKYTTKDGEELVFKYEIEELPDRDKHDCFHEDIDALDPEDEEDIKEINEAKEMERESVRKHITYYAHM
jgi:hypothetical protein